MVNNPTQPEPDHDVAWLDELSVNEATAELLKCCGSQRWASQMVAARPFGSFSVLSGKANDLWWALEPGDWLEAFRGHPKIGEKKAATPASAQAQHWSGQEQSGLQNAAQTTVEMLARLNGEYEAKFGYIFIVCATGKSSEEMLTILRERLNNEAAKELPIAAAEQAKITELRLRKLVGGP